MVRPDSASVDAKRKGNVGVIKFDGLAPGTLAVTAKLLAPSVKIWF